jgi:hypothetical protein
LRDHHGLRQLRPFSERFRTFQAIPRISGDLRGNLPAVASQLNRVGQSVPNVSEIKGEKP